MVSGRDQRLRIYMRQAGVDELNRRLTLFPTSTRGIASRV
jgi:hypothetical protein